MSISVTTAFKNIGRGDWDDFNRGIDTYFEGFFKLVDHCPFPMFVYLEQDMMEMLKEKRPEGLPQSVTLIPMESVTKAPVYTHDEKNTEVLNSKEFKQAIKGMNTGHPERSKTSYNMITSSKAAFVQFTKSVAPEFDYYVWQDFGTVNLIDDGVGLPREVDQDKLANQIVIQALGKREKHHPWVMARIPGASIAGGTIIIPTDLVDWFAEEVIKMIERFHKMWLTDDDQNVYLQIAWDHPNNFYLGYVDKRWCRLWELLP